MIVVGPRIVIPQAVRADILRDLLLMHQGATKTRQRARLSVYWPNIDNDIINATRSCEECTKHLPSLPPEPFRMRQPATRPFEQIHADLGEINGRHFLILVDGFSGWPHVVAFRDTNTTARRVVDHIRNFFSNVGAPLAFWSDNGPQFGASEFRNFLKDWGILALTSSPYYAQSNGRAESEINTMKSLIRGSWTSGTFDEAKFAKSILIFRNAPRSGGASPAQIVFNRPVRDCLPAHRRSFAPEWQRAADVLEKRARRSKELQVAHYNKKAHRLAPFVVGNHVIIQHPISKLWDTPGIVVEVGQHRDYLIKSPAGRIFRRNRRFLRRRIPTFPAPANPPPQVIVPPPEPAQDQQNQPDPILQPGPTSPPPPRRSARPRQPRRVHFPNDWTQ